MNKEKIICVHPPSPSCMEGIIAWSRANEALPIYFFSNSRSTTEYLKQVSSYFCFHGDLLKMRFTFSGAARLHDYFDKNNSFARLFPNKL